MALVLRSSAFDDRGEIPVTYTCDGEDISPPLSWSGIPSGTKSLAIIVDDPDVPDPAAPQRTWVHWILYNLPANVNGIPEGITRLPAQARAGMNDWKRTDYGGPCPPKGRHRYFHKLYALDVVLRDLGTPTKAELERAMRGHILEEAHLLGMYERTR